MTVRFIIALALLCLGISAVLACGDDSQCQATGTDSTDESTDSDSETVSTFPILARLDAATGLMWQSYPDLECEWEAAIAYCHDLTLEGYGDWRLPTISELRSFIRGCKATMTGGACGVTDECLSSECAEDCVECEELKGPGPDGCYWDAKLGGPCEWHFGNWTWWNWSSSSHTLMNDCAWGVFFGTGLVDYSSKDYNTHHARCVRGPDWP